MNDVHASIDDHQDHVQLVVCSTVLCYCLNVIAMPQN